MFENFLEGFCFVNDHLCISIIIEVLARFPTSSFKASFGYKFLVIISLFLRIWRLYFHVLGLSNVAK